MKYFLRTRMKAPDSFLYSHTARSKCFTCYFPPFPIGSQQMWLVNLKRNQFYKVFFHPGTDNRANLRNGNFSNRISATGFVIIWKYLWKVLQSSFASLSLDQIHWAGFEKLYHCSVRFMCSQYTCFHFLRLYSPNIRKFTIQSKKKKIRI